jgi:hypothetical protein
MTIKAKRILKNFDFSGQGARVDLVCKEQGGAANGYTTLIYKSVDKLPDIEQDIDIYKALEQVTVSISMEEFLRKFFGMWSDDAEVLTKLLGFETEFENSMKDKSYDEYDWKAEHQKWIESKVSQFTIMKSMNSGELKTIKASDLEQIVSLQKSIEPEILKHFDQKEKLVEKELLELKAKFEAQQAQIAEIMKAKEDAEKALADAKAEIEQAKEAEITKALELELKEYIADEAQLAQVVKSVKVLKSVDAEQAQAMIDVLKSKSIAKENAIVDGGLLDEQSHNTVVVEKSAINVSALNAMLSAQVK